MRFSGSMEKSLKLLCISFIAVMVSVVLRLPSESREAGGENSETCILLIIDLTFLNCPLCVQSLADFIAMVQANGLENSVFGILVFDREKKKADLEKYMRIIEKRLRGFVIGHNIKFPIFLDQNGVFNLVCQQASALLVLFDVQNRRIKEYSFPLSRAELDEISRFLQS